MKGFLLRTFGGTLVVFFVVAVILALLSVPALLFGLLALGLLIFFGWLLGWFIWGQGPPKI